MQLDQKISNKKVLITPIVLGVVILIASIIFVILDSDVNFPWVLRSEKYPDKHNTYRLYDHFGGFYDLLYFTFQTNFILGICMICYGCLFKKEKVQSYFAVSVFLITVTFLIFWLGIAPFNSAHKWKSIYWLANNFSMHLIHPLYGMIYLIIARKRIHVNIKMVHLSSLYFPIFFCFNAIIYGTCSQIQTPDGQYQFDPSYIYKFIDCKEPLGIKFSENLFPLAVILNILICISSPFLYLLFPLFYIKVLKLEADGKVYSFLFRKNKKVEIKEEINSQV